MLTLFFTFLYSVIVFIQWYQLIVKLKKCNDIRKFISLRWKYKVKKFALKLSLKLRQTYFPYNSSCSAKIKKIFVLSKKKSPFNYKILHQNNYRCRSFLKWVNSLYLLWWFWQENCSTFINICTRFAFLRRIHICQYHYSICKIH